MAAYPRSAQASTWGTFRSEQGPGAGLVVSPAAALGRGVSGLPEVGGPRGGTLVNQSTLGPYFRGAPLSVTRGLGGCGGGGH